MKFNQLKKSEKSYIFNDKPIVFKYKPTNKNHYYMLILVSQMILGSPVLPPQS